MTSDAIKSQITVIAEEHPALHEFISLNKNKHFVSRKIKAILENALLNESGADSDEKESKTIRKPGMAENFKPSDTKPIVEKEETKNVITRQKNRHQYPHYPQMPFHNGKHLETPHPLLTSSPP
jgi:hypothetical protein